ncbi:hypothetical protein GCM10023091_23730 [Ravibacter arvi]|uniref:DUF6787 domain-containing protein n=1 Tax=Ravibacter arvi TaxID=2051041 RepID=A0ABP8LZ60_9BACT
MWDKLKTRWNVNSGLDVVIILVVFACTGFSVLYAKKGLFGLIGIDDNTPSWIRICLSIFVILPLYQVVLLCWGWIFGKFNFFWEFEKRTFSRIAKIWRKN